MATSFSKAWETKLLKIFTNNAVSGLANTWIALYTTSPTRTGAGVEAEYTGYKRIKVEAAGWTLVEGTEIEAGYIKNTAKVEFPTCTGGESKCVSAGITTAESAGELISFGALFEEKVINISSTPCSFPAGELRFAIS